MNEITTEKISLSASNRPPTSPSKSRKVYIDLLWCTTSLFSLKANVKRNSSLAKSSVEATGYSMS